MSTRHLGRSTVSLVLVVSALGTVCPAMAQTAAASAGADAVKNAAGHFQRGVALYKDGDYGGALVEFRRAYDLSPNYRVLYNIGQSLYQVQRHAEALTAFEGYLAQGGAQIGPARRATVEADLRVLRGRVGHVEVSVNAVGAEVRVDDQVVGTSPLQAPVLVSVGHRKITVSKGTQAPLEKFIDVAVGDRTKVSFEFAEPAPAPVVVQVPTAAPPPSPEPKPASTALTPSTASAAASPEPTSDPPSSAPVWVSWTVTGVLAAGTVATGVLTLTSKTSLSNQLQTFPGDPGAIDADRSRAKAFATASDVLLAATAVSFGVALYVTLARPREHAAAGARLGLGFGPSALQLRGEY